MSVQDSELIKIVEGFRLKELQALLTYAGKNKRGKKTELQSKALDLIKLHSQPISMKIQELYMSRHQQKRDINETSNLYPLTPVNEGIANTYGTPSYDNDIVEHLSPHSDNLELVVNKLIERAVPNLNVIPPYAVNPDVRFDLPFYDVVSEVLPPTSLVSSLNEQFQVRDLVFNFTPPQFLLLDSSSDIQVQLRISLLETSCEQEDELLTGISIKINRKLAILPKIIPTNKESAEPKCQRLLLDITSICWRTASKSNKIHISWASVICRPCATAVFLVRKLSATTLIRRLEANGVRNPDHTIAMIKKKLSQHCDSEIVARGSLICPLGKIKMKLPCRALTCTHLQCFDATTYVQENEKKPNWICPVCDKSAIFPTLAIDGLFLDITSKAPSQCTEVLFHEDGSWSPVLPVKKMTKVSDATLETVPKKDVPKPKKFIEVISLVSDSETEDFLPLAPPGEKPCRLVDIISPVLFESPKRSHPSESVVERTFDPLVPCSSKSYPSSFKSNLGSSEKSTALPRSLRESDVCCLNPTTSPVKNLPNSNYSPVSPPQTFCQPASNIPSTSTIHNPLELLSSTPITSGGQCSFSNFDLYSPIQPNNEDFFDFPSNLEEDATPDVIFID